MEDTTELIIVESIRDHVYMLRGEQVMIDSDLADIYGYELKAMNQQVRRNIDRFPEDFMFQMTSDEVWTKVRQAVNKAVLTYPYLHPGKR